MGHKNLEPIQHDIQEDKASYSIISFPAKDLPTRYVSVVRGEWKKSLRYGNDHFKLVEQAHYFWAYERYIEMLTQRPDALIRLAVLTDDHDTVLGWCFTRGDKLDYVWVQRDQRNQGICKALVPKYITTITHITKNGLRIWADKAPQLTYKPF